jgi:hypothetical protein
MPWVSITHQVASANFCVYPEYSMANGADPHKDLQFPAWEREYRVAVEETNPLYLGEKIHLAEEALSKRLKSMDDAPANSAEREAIAQARDTLQQLLIKTFGHSDWQT